MRSMWGTWSCSARHARGPHVGRFGEVGVDVDDVDAVEQIQIRTGHGGHASFSHVEVQMPSGQVPITSSASSSASSSSVHPNRAPRISCVVLADRRGGAASPPFHAAEPERQRGDRMGPCHRMHDFLEEAAMGELRVERGAAGVEGGSGGNPGRDEHFDGLVELERGRPFGEASVEVVVARAPARVVVERGVECPFGRPEDLHQRAPLLVGCDREREPLLAPATGVEALGRGPRAAASFADELVAVRRPFDDELGGDVQGCFEHRRLDQSTLAGAVTARQCHQRGERGVHAAVGVARAPLDPRLVVDVTGEPRETGDLFHGLREAGAIAPRAVEPERGHAHHHRARVGGVHDVPAEVELLEHARGEVLDHEIGACDQPQEEVAPGGAGEIERDALLVEVGLEEERAQLPPLRSVHERTPGHAHAVDAGDRLDVDHVGAERREHAGGRGPGPPRGQVDDPHAVERQARAAGRHRSSRRPAFDGAGVLAESGRGRDGGRASPAIDHGRRG